MKIKFKSEMLRADLSVFKIMFNFGQSEKMRAETTSALVSPILQNLRYGIKTYDKPEIRILVVAIQPKESQKHQMDIVVFLNAT